MPCVTGPQLLSGLPLAEQQLVEGAGDILLEESHYGACFRGAVCFGSLPAP